MLFNAVLISVLFAITALFVVYPSDPQESWAHRLACVIPLSAIAGTVLALAASGA
jgi:hypothetical protein